MLEFVARLFGKNTTTIRSVAEAITAEALVCGQVYVSTMPKNADGTATTHNDSIAHVTHEFLYFFLHYVDRLAFEFGGEPALDKIRDDIVLQVCGILITQMSEANRQGFMDMFQEGLGEADRAYAKCSSIFSVGEESLKGTALWVAGNRISIAAGGGEKNLSSVVAASGMLSDSLSSLKLEGRIKYLAAR